MLKYKKTPTGFLNLRVNKVVFSPGLRHKSFGIHARFSYEITATKPEDTFLYFNVSSHSGAFG